MQLAVTTTPTPEAAPLAVALRNEFEALLADLTGAHAFGSSLSAVLVFVLIVDPRRGAIPDSLVVRRSENSVWSSVNVPHDKFLAAEDNGRIDMFASAVSTAILQIRDKNLPPDDKAFILQSVDEARRELLRRRGFGVSAQTPMSAPDIAESEAPRKIVLQWTDHSPLPRDPSAHCKEQLELLSAGDLDPHNALAMEGSLQAQSVGTFEVDGHDVGSGSINIFLTADDIDAAVRHVIEIYERGALRPGMRIAVESTEAGHPTYLPVYPPGLRTFDLFTDHSTQG